MSINYSTSLKSSLVFADQEKITFQNKLIDLLKIPSISTDRLYQEAIHNASKVISNRLLNLGFLVQVSENNHPIIYAERVLNPDYPTLLFYGHYDVQPPDPLEEWSSPPFEPTIKNRRIYARGASDDKGQLSIHLNAVESILSCKEALALPINFKFLIEGEEEISSPSLFPYLSKHTDQLACDTIVISDTEMYGPDQPAITYGLRGIIYLEVFIKGPSRDVHSGMYGGVIDNPANVLADLIKAIKPNHKIAIPGFYDDVREITSFERAIIDQLPFDEEYYRKELGVKEFSRQSQEDFSFFLQNSSLSTFDVNGLTSGYQGSGAKTIIPSTASAKFSFRTVPDQQVETTVALIKDFIKKQVPNSVELDILDHGSGDPFFIDPQNQVLEFARKSLKEIYPTEPRNIRSGGSIPIVAELKKQLGAEVVILGFGLSEDRIHSPNESFSLLDFERGTQTMIHFIHLLAEKGLTNKKLNR